MVTNKAVIDKIREALNVESGIGLLAALLITSIVMVLAHYSDMHEWISQTWKPIIIIALTANPFIKLLNKKNKLLLFLFKRH